MELARILKILWQRRRLVALGALVAGLAAMLSVYTVSLFPPRLEPRTNVFATASTQLLVDTPNSAFADLENEMTPLETRASVFARFLATPAAIELISKDSGVPADQIEAAGPYDINLPVIDQEPTAGQRSSQIIGEGALYRLRFENNPVLPIVSVYAQAPTEDEAMALANAVPRALSAYITAIQAHQNTPRSRRVVIRPLGEAIGGVVNKNANVEIGLLVFLVVFGAWCMLLVPAQTIARSWRETWSADDPDRASRKGPKGPEGNAKRPKGKGPRKSAKSGAS
jgi:capsular polysaccharide biosynthesis protein